MGIFLRTASASQEHQESLINNAITRAAMTAATQTASEKPPALPVLDISFLLPGKHEKPAFNGMQMGGYTSEEGTLYFQCSVPEAMINSNQAAPYVIAVIDDAISNAVEYFKLIDTDFNQSSWLNFAKLLKQNFA